MDDATLEGLSPSTNTTYTTLIVMKILLLKQMITMIWEVPAWAHNRWTNIKRDYTKEDVNKASRVCQN